MPDSIVRTRPTTRLETLRLALDGTWTTDEFTSLLHATQTLYSLLCPGSLSRAGEDRPARDLRYWIGPTVPTPSHVLTTSKRHGPEQYPPSPIVRRISLASPGQLDLLGLGRVMREIRMLIKDLSYRNRAERRAAEIRERIETARAIQEEQESQRREIELERLTLRNRVLHRAVESWEAANGDGGVLEREAAMASLLPVVSTFESLGAHQKLQDVSIAEDGGANAPP